MNACSSPEKCERNNVLRAIKQKLKHHLNRQLWLAARDIDSARQSRASQDSAEFVDQQMAMAKSYPDKFALLKAAIARIDVHGLCCEFGVYRGETINFHCLSRSREKCTASIRLKVFRKTGGRAMRRERSPSVLCRACIRMCGYTRDGSKIRYRPFVSSIQDRLPFCTWMPISIALQERSLICWGTE